MENDQLENYLDQTGEAAVLLAAAVARTLVQSNPRFSGHLTKAGTDLVQQLNSEGKQRAADLVMKFLGLLA